MRVKRFDIQVINEDGNKRLYKRKSELQKRIIEKHLKANKQRILNVHEYYVEEG